MSTPTEISRITRSESKWVKLQEIEYKDPLGVVRKWDCTERTTKNGDIDAVEVLGILKSNETQKDQLILACQYRPPVRSFVLEFPAGLMDVGESPSQSGLRELYEETGYRGTAQHESPGLVIEGGVLNEESKILTVHINSSENSNPKPQLDDGEFVETVILPMYNLLDHIEDFCKMRNAKCDAKLYTFALGLKMASQFIK